MVLSVNYNRIQEPCLKEGVCVKNVYESYLVRWVFIHIIVDVKILKWNGITDGWGRGMLNCSFLIACLFAASSVLFTVLPVYPYLFFKT